MAAVAKKDANNLPEFIGPDNAPALFDDGDLGLIGKSGNAFADAMSMFENTGQAVEDWANFGNGFTVVKDKNTLVGVPFVAVQWRFNDGTYGDFVSVALVTEDGRKLILNDGSLGIRKDMQTVTEQRKSNNDPNPQAGLLVRNGLRRSDYTYTDEKGQDLPATTFYLA